MMTKNINGHMNLDQRNEKYFAELKKALRRSSANAQLVDNLKFNIKANKVEDEKS